MTNGTSDRKPPATAAAASKRKRLASKLEQPGILVELARRGLSLSAEAQANFIDVLDTIATDLRQIFLDSKLIQRVQIDQKATWEAFKGKRLGFIDGGVANISAIGAAPVAIRVGSYVVTPGVQGPDRERFGFQVQLVDELYQTGEGSTGVYEDFFEDVGKLRDAARIVCEVGGVLQLAKSGDAPGIIFLHGPLVNPVSPYALGQPGATGAFPNFTGSALEILLAGNDAKRGGRQANFVTVYLEQLQRLASGKVTTCGVVERPSSGAPGPLVMQVLKNLVDERTLPADTYDKTGKMLRQYQITDSLIFECILDEGEYLTPIPMDKQGADAPWSKIPDAWRTEIISYPRPQTTYVKANAGTMPIRLEFFETGPLGKDSGQLVRLVVHMSRLLPRYSFPVGLDIVDKHAKVPAWMSRQINAMLAARLMQKAMETKDPRMVRIVRRVLSSNTRDWLFRPDYKGN